MKVGNEAAKLSLEVAVCTKIELKHENHGYVIGLVPCIVATYICNDCQMKPDLLFSKNVFAKPTKLMRLARFLNFGHTDFSSRLI